MCIIYQECIKQYLNSMKMSSKPLKFFNKILKHYPVPSPQQSHKCESECNSHNASCSSHTHTHTHNPTNTSQQFQPFQHMHDHRKQREIYDKPTKQKLQNMRYFKELGSNSFKDKKYDQALYYYQKAIIYSDYTFPDQQGEIAQMELLVQQVNVNIGICLVKKNQWNKAIINFRQATKKGDASTRDTKLKKLVYNTCKKGYYWMTKYYMKEGDYENAQNSIKQLNNLQSEVSCTEQAAELSKQLQQQMKKYNEKAQNLSKKMFVSCSVSQQK